jgi:glucose-1-phosphate adenylyltransferase
VRRSVLSPNVRVNSYALVEESILLDGVEVGRHSRVRRAIIDKDVKLPPHTVIGYDAEADRRRGFTITANGVVVVPKGHPSEAFGG